jgi:hypothetical protein
MKIAILSIALAVATSFSAHAAEYLYSKLEMKTYDEMQNEVKLRIQKAEKEGNTDIDSARNRLRDALQLIFSRPNADNMVSQLIPLVRTPLKNIDAYESELSAVAGHAIDNLSDGKASATVRATGLLVLQNMMSELKPDAAHNPQIKAIFEKIRDAKVKVPDSVKNELLMRSSIKAGTPPSELAAKILNGGK